MSGIVSSAILVILPTVTSVVKCRAPKPGGRGREYGGGIPTL